MSGFIQIGRELQNHWLRRDKDYWMVFCEMYFLARYADKSEVRNIEGYEVIIHQKEFIFGRPGWSVRLDISEQRLKTLIKKMVAEGLIKKVKKYNRFTVYSFEYIPSINQHNNQQSNQQEFPEQPAEPLVPQGFENDSNQQNFSNQPAQQPAQQPMKEEGIKEEGIKEEGLNHKGAKNMPSKSKIDKSRQGKTEYTECVWLKREEHEKLLSEFGQEGLTWMLDVLSSYKLSVDKFYASDYAVFKRGGWLRQKYEEHLVKQKQSYKSKEQQRQEEMDLLKQFSQGGSTYEQPGNLQIAGGYQDGIS